MSALGGELAGQLGLCSAQADRLVRSVAGLIVAHARRGERVVVPGLGVFRVRQYRARVVRHRGRHHQIPARSVLTFRASSGVRVLAVEEG